MKIKQGAGAALGAVMLILTACASPVRPDLFRLADTKQVQSIAFASPNNHPPSLSFQAGTTMSQTVSIAFTPSAVSNKNVTWTSANGKVTIVPTGPNTATVTPVTGAGAPIVGDTDTITAVPADGGTALKKTCAVVFTGVSTVPVTGISLDQTALSVATAGSATLKVTISPTGSSVQTVNWSISSTTTASATFSAGGTTATTSSDQSTVTIVGGTPGTGVKVTATLVDGSNTFTKTCDVTVTGVAVDTVTIDQVTTTLLENETQTLTATVLPVNASSPTVTWSSSNSTKISVNPTTGVVQAQTASGGATAVITASAGGKSTSITIAAEAAASVPALGTPASPGGGTYTGATMALDPSDGLPAIAYSDGSGNGHVQRWLGTAWSTNMSTFNVGAFLIDTSLATNLALAVDSAGNPTVAYIASSNSSVSVTQWDGTVWNPLNGADSTTSRYLALAIGQYHSVLNANVPDTPYLAMASNEGSSPQFAAIEVHDAAFSPPTWALPTTGTLSYDGPNSTSTSLLLNPKYDFTTNPGVDSAFVASLISGSTVVAYGFPSKALKAQTTVSGASFVSLGVDGQGLLYVAYTDAGGTARLLQQSSSSFVQTAQIGSGSADHLSLVFDPRAGMKVAYVSFRDVSTGQASLWKWDNGTFGLLIADVSGVGAQVQGTKLVMSSTGHLYYMYESSGNVVVKDFNR